MTGITRSSYEKPNWFSDYSTGCNWATRILGVGEKSVTGRTRTANWRTYQKGEEIAITENENWAQKWFPVRYRCSIWFYILNTGINLPKLFPSLPSNCTTGQIQFSWYVRNESSSAGVHVWGFVFATQRDAQITRMTYQDLLMEASVSCTTWRPLSCTTV